MQLTKYWEIALTRGLYKFMGTTSFMRQLLKVTILIGS